MLSSSREAEGPRSSSSEQVEVSRTITPINPGKKDTSILRISLKRDRGWRIETVDIPCTRLRPGPRPRPCTTSRETPTLRSFTVFTRREEQRISFHSIETVSTATAATRNSIRRSKINGETRREVHSNALDTQLAARSRGIYQRKILRRTSQSPVPIRIDEHS